MGSFDFHTPATLDEALDVLGQHGDEAHAIAGGTSVVLMLKQGLIAPGHVVSLRGIPGLQGIQRTPEGGLRIGALSTHRQVETHPDVQAYCPALTETAGHVATIRIRNQGTLGGNLVHADPAQDPPPMLLALGAEAALASSSGERRVPLDEFFVDYFETAVQPGEVLTQVVCPPLPPGTRAGYVKFLPRTQDDYATVAVGATLRLDENGVCQQVRIGLGSVGTTPLRARAVEQALQGQTLSENLIKEAAAVVRDEVDPLDDVRGSAGYKREMARVWTARLLTRLATGDGASRTGSTNGVAAH